MLELKPKAKGWEEMSNQERIEDLKGVIQKMAHDVSKLVFEMNLIRVHTHGRRFLGKPEIRVEDVMKG